MAEFNMSQDGVSSFDEVALPSNDVFSKKIMLAIKDVVTGTTNVSVWTHMAFSDIKKRYRRTLLGPFWATISLAIFIASMGLIFSNLWRMDMVNFMPYFTSGFVVWVLVSTIITESCSSLIAFEGLIKQVPIPYLTFSWVVVLRNFIVLMHHSLVYIVVFIACGVKLNANFLLLLPASLIIIFTGIWASLLISICCARFRDLLQVVSSVLQISMFVTPIFWPPENLGSGGRAVLLLNGNPLYHFINIMRAPLLGQQPTAYNWCFSIVFSLIGACLTFFVFANVRRKIIYWL